MPSYTNENKNTYKTNTCHTTFLDTESFDFDCNVNVNSSDFEVQTVNIDMNVSRFNAFKVVNSDEINIVDLHLLLYKEPFNFHQEYSDADLFFVPKYMFTFNV